MTSGSNTCASETPNARMTASDPDAIRVTARTSCSVFPRAIAAPYYVMADAVRQKSVEIHHRARSACETLRRACVGACRAFDGRLTGGPSPWLLASGDDQVSVATNDRQMLVDPFKRPDHRRSKISGTPATSAWCEGRQVGMTRQIEHPDPAGNEQNGGFRNDSEPAGLDHRPKRAARVRFFISVLIETDG
jgi:hypothetical protein